MLLSKYVSNNHVVPSIVRKTSSSVFPLRPKLEFIIFFPNLFSLLLMYMYVSAWTGPVEAREGHAISRELELKLILSSWTCGLGTKLRSSGRAVLEPHLQPHF